MVRGLYTNGWSMLAHGRKMDVIANNLANVNTHGFKKETASLGSFPELMVERIYDVRSPSNPTADVGMVELSADIDQNFVYFNAGATEWTERSLDVAIDDFDGEESAYRARSFFTVATEDAETGEETRRYTRDGSFVLDVNGVLRTQAGEAVLGVGGGQITLAGYDCTISKDGTILQGDQAVGQLLITSFEDPHALRKVGENLLEATDAAVETPFGGIIRQGYLEQSNVNVVSEMVDMITVMRAYEANQKMLWFIDGTLDKAVNEVARV